MVKLSDGNLARLAGGKVVLPGYERRGLKRGIVHIGVGGFHRAHQAVYTDEALAAGAREWGIVGAGIQERDAAMRDALLSQDCLYTVLSKGSRGAEARVIGSMVEYRYGGQSTASVVDAMSGQDTRIISLTVTEDGYCYDSRRELDRLNPGVVHDLAHPTRPVTVIGCIAEALDRVRRRRGAPPTIVSCDNLPHNGEMLRRLVLAFAAERDRDLARFVEADVLFPNTMVDRITPITRDEHREELARDYGVVDAWPVVCEDFRQWFVEDRFTRGRPDWTIGGASFVPSVIPYERMKIRLLNGAHMALSHMAYLAGYRDVDQAMADPQVRAFVVGFMEEATPTVGAVPGVDLAQYKATLVERFSNQAIRDQVYRLTMDSSNRIPNMLLLTLVDLLDAGQPAPHIAFSNAAWIRFATAVDESGAPIAVDDRQAERMREAAVRSVDDARPFLSLEGIFPERVARDQRYVDRVSGYLRDIRGNGVRAALGRFLRQQGESA